MKMRVRAAVSLYAYTAWLPHQHTHRTSAPRSITTTPKERPTPFITTHHPSSSSHPQLPLSASRRIPFPSKQPSDSTSPKKSISPPVPYTRQPGTHKPQPQIPTPQAELQSPYPTYVRDWTPLSNDWIPPSCAWTLRPGAQTPISNACPLQQHGRLLHSIPW